MVCLRSTQPLPFTCQLGTAAASTVSPGCQFRFVTVAGIARSVSAAQSPPLESGDNPPTPTSFGEGYMVGADAAAARRSPRRVSARPRGGLPRPEHGRPGVRREGPRCRPRLAPARPPARTDVGGGRPHPARLLSHRFPALPAPRAGGRGGRGGDRELRSQLWISRGGTERKPSVRSKSDTRASWGVRARSSYFPGSQAANSIPKFPKPRPPYAHILYAPS